MKHLQTLLAVLWAITVTGGLVLGRMAESDIDQLVEFILNKDRGRHGHFKLAVNDTVRLAVDGLKDRLKCVQQGLTHLQCAQCLKPENVLATLGPDSKSVVTNHLDVEHLSVVLLNHALTFRTACRPKDNGITSCKSYIVCRNQLLARLPIGDPNTAPIKLLEDIEAVLREIKAFYEPIPGAKCFSAENVLTELPKVNTDADVHLEQLTTLLVAHLLKGECIDVGEAVTDFLEDIFVHYGDQCNRVITQTGFEKLMSDLRTQDRDDHEEHSMVDNSCSSIFKDDSNRKKTPDQVITMTEVGGIPKELLDQNIYVTKDVNKRATRGTAQSSADKHEHRSLANKCLSADGILRKFSLIPSQTITPVQFLQLCPALVQQVVSGVCKDSSNSSVTAKYTRPTNLEIYGYGTLAVFVISLSSLCGIFLLPILAKNCYKYIMMGFIGLSFGTMAGDSLLHLIPQQSLNKNSGWFVCIICYMIVHHVGRNQRLNVPFDSRYIYTQSNLLDVEPNQIDITTEALGLHSHEETESDDDHEGLSLETIPYYIWQQLGIFVAIYLLFLFETITNALSGDHHEEGHGHSHVPDKLPESLTMKTINGHNPSQGHISEDFETHGKKEPVIKSTEIFWGLTTMSLVIVIGDTFHNFGDGLAIGASFAPGIRGGLSTSLAVFCHELPHEFGDFVVLLSTGLSFGKALTVNFISALFSFVGLYIGIQLGEDLTTRNWILTVTAGIFLYVALTEMLPELKSNKSGNKWGMFLVKNLGILSGLTIMIIIAIYEEHFHL